MISLQGKKNINHDVLITMQEAKPKFSVLPQLDCLKQRGCWDYSSSDKCMRNYQINKITALQRALLDLAQDTLICDFSKIRFLTFLIAHPTATIRVFLSRLPFHHTLAELLHHF